MGSTDSYALPQYVSSHGRRKLNQRTKDLQANVKLCKFETADKVAISGRVEVVRRRGMLKSHESLMPEPGL